MTRMVDLHHPGLKTGSNQLPAKASQYLFLLLFIRGGWEGLSFSWERQSPGWRFLLSEAGKMDERIYRI